MSANTRRTFVERLRITGLYEDVRAAMALEQDRGFRVVRGPNPLRDERGLISSTRSGVTLERAAFKLDAGDVADLLAAARKAKVESIAASPLTAEDCLDAQDLLDRLAGEGRGV